MDGWAYCMGDILMDKWFIELVDLWVNGLMRNEMSS